MKSNDYSRFSGLRLSLEDVRHEKDSSLISSIMNGKGMGKLSEFITENNLEYVYTYVFRTSYVRLTAENSAVITDMVKTACTIFGLEKIPDVYVTREYGGTVSVKGFSEPFILIYSRYLESADEISLFGEICSAIAGILANHHKAAFIADVLDAATNQLPWIAALGYDALINSWKRARYYTYDRAFLAVTGDYSLTLRHLLLGRIPPEILRSCEGNIEELLTVQADIFTRLTHDNTVFTALQKMTVNEAWIPERFIELRRCREDRLC